MVPVVDLQELASRYRTWDTADLVRASEIEADTYSPEALALLRQELASRGQKPAEVEAEVFRTLAADREKLRGVKGFLALMLVDIASRSLFDLAGAVLLLTSRPSRMLSLLALAAAGMGLSGLFVCLLVLRKDRRAPRAASAWFVLVGLTIATVLFYNSSRGDGFNWVAMVIFYPILFYPLLWVPYLHLSRRAKVTFGAPPEPPPDLTAFD